MRAQLINLLRELQSSYWFIPTLMVFAAMLLALISDRLDSALETTFLKDVPWIYQTQTSGARAVLSAIATSMIGVAGVTFSMTLVAVSFAASNIGPRLIANFMRDRGNQITLGTFIATFVYCLLILRTVTDPGDNDSTAYIPHLSILIALMLALLSVGNLIYFIHHIPESINVARIAYRIAEELRVSIQSLFPEDVGFTTKHIDPSEPLELGASFRVESQQVRAAQSGYLQVIDDDSLLALAEDHDLVLRIEYRPGDFAQAGSVLLYAHPSAQVSDKIAEELSACFIVGLKKTSSQNAMFLVDQLVEIMIRALSPGVNDPFTAVGCIDWLQSALADIAVRPEPDSHRYDDTGNLRMVVHAVSFERFVTAVFEKPLQYVASDRTASLRLMEALAELIVICKDPQRLKLLTQQAQRLAKAGSESLPLSADQNELQRRCEQTLRLASNPEREREMRDSQGWLGGRA